MCILHETFIRMRIHHPFLSLDLCRRRLKVREAKTYSHNNVAGMDLVFINVKEPKDALKLAKAPEIRSHVTRYQWNQWKRLARRDIEQRKKARSCSQDLNGATCQNESDSLTSTLPPISISPQIGGLRVDPFKSYPISDRPEISLLVDHCK